MILKSTRRKRKAIITTLLLPLVTAVMLVGCGTDNNNRNSMPSQNTGGSSSSTNDPPATSPTQAAVEETPSSTAPAQTDLTDAETNGTGDDLVITISEISEIATFYPITVDDTRMEIFAVKASDGTIRTAFNTCQVCNGSPLAYFKQSGTSVQCQNCGNDFPMNRVGIESGGCNPVPILDDDKIVTDESITILYDTLQANAYRFPENWKQ